MLLAGFLGKEQAGGFDDDIGAHFAPFQFGRILDGGQADLFAVDYQGIAFDRNAALEAAMYRVVTQHIGQVIRFEQVVDAHNLYVSEILRRCAEHHAPNATEPVNTDTNCHFFLLGLVIKNTLWLQCSCQ